MKGWRTSTTLSMMTWLSTTPLRRTRMVQAGTPSKDNPYRDYIWRSDPGIGMRRQPIAEQLDFRFSPSVGMGTRRPAVLPALLPSSSFDLNWEKFRRRLHIMRFWLDKGVDGFRMDVINLIATSSREFSAVLGGLDNSLGCRS